MTDRDSAAELRATIERYNQAWNAHDLDAIMAIHAPDMVFENHTAGDLVAEPTVKTVTWDGLDVIPFSEGLIKRKDVYSDSVSILRQLGLSL